MKKSGVQGLEIWLVGIVKLLKLLRALGGCTAPTSEDKVLQGAWPALEGEGSAMARGDVVLQAFHGTQRGRSCARHASPRPDGGSLGLFKAWRANGPGSVLCSEISPPTGSRAKVCTDAMSYINLPTVLPSSPSKTRGQIQVRGLGWGRVVAGAGCATGGPLR